MRVRNYLIIFIRYWILLLQHRPVTTIPSWTGAPVCSPRSTAIGIQANGNDASELALSSEKPNFFVCIIGARVPLPDILLDACASAYPDIFKKEGRPECI
jgi:hypothetical protein